MLFGPQRGTHMKSTCCSIPSVTESDLSLGATRLSRCSSTFTEDWSRALRDTELCRSYTRTFSPRLSALLEDYIKESSAEKLSLDLRLVHYDSRSVYEDWLGGGIFFFFVRFACYLDIRLATGLLSRNRATHKPVPWQMTQRIRQ